MHELSVCQALLRQVRATAESRGAELVHAINVRVGPLSGVEPELLEAAYEVARRDTIAANATLVVERTAVAVRCRVCGESSDASPGRLACGRCGSPDTELVGGDECMLVSVELTVAEE